MLPRDKMTQLLDRHSELEQLMSSNPDPETYVKLASEFSELGPVVEKIQELKSTESERLHWLQWGRGYR